MTARALDDVEAIRRLLAPERTARRPVPAQGLRAVTVRIDGRPVRVHFADVRELDDDTIPDRIREARARTRTGDRELIGMPTAAERRARTDAALARLASVGPEPPPARLTAVYQQMIDGRLTR